MVSIIIPVYRGADYLCEAIDSALAQTHPNVEVLVIDDGSDDGGATEAIARSYGDRIRYLRKENGGVATALNLGIAEMRGAYFSWLSHDDLYLPDKVAAQLARLAPGQDDVVLFSDFEYVDHLGKHLRTRRLPEVHSMRVALITGDPVNGCTVLVPRRCFDRVGLFDPQLRTVQDYDMWFRLADHFRFVHVPQVLVRSRVHPRQGIRTIPTHLAETSGRLIHFLRTLREDEIRQCHRGSLSAFYGRLALIMKLRGFDDVARVALDVSRSHLAGAGLAARVHHTAIALACATLTRKLKPGYWLARARAAGWPQRGRQPVTPRTILFLDQSLVPGGATRVMLDLVGALDPRLVRAVVVCRKGSGVEDLVGELECTLEPLDLPVVTFARPRSWPRLLLRLVASVNGLRRIVSRHRPDAIHASGLVAVLLAALPARTARVPLIWHVHDLVERRPRNTPFVRLAAASSRTAVCVSAFSRAALSSFGVEASKCIVVHNAMCGGSAKGEPVDPLAGVDGERPVILAIGTITPLKGHDVLVEALQRIVERHPEVLVAVAGQPADASDWAYFERLQGSVARLGLDANVRFLGFVRGVAGLLGRATIVAHPSTREETFGLVPLEAMAAGRPVVVSRVGGLPEIVTDGECGFVVEPGQSAPLAAALETLLDDAALRERMGRAGARIAAERFGASTFLHGMNDVFCGIIGIRPFRTRPAEAAASRGSPGSPTAERPPGSGAR